MIKYCGAKRRNCKKEKILTYNRGGFFFGFNWAYFGFFFQLWGKYYRYVFFHFKMCEKLSNGTSHKKL